MKYAAKLYTTENDVLTKFGFNPEVSVIKSLTFNQETGDIEVLIHSSELAENAVETEHGYVVRRQRVL